MPRSGDFDTLQHFDRVLCGELRIMVTCLLVVYLDPCDRMGVVIRFQLREAEID